MAISLAPYSLETFNALHDFGDTEPLFESVGGDYIANGPMKDLFRHHGVDRVFGLALLHKHGLLFNNERLTNIRGTSNPVDFVIGNPSRWKIGPSNTLEPLEFSNESQHINLQDTKIQLFLVAFFSKVKELQADNLFGLAIYPGDDDPGSVEFTSGRSNINLTPEEASQYLPSDRTREAAWFYSDSWIKRGCRCNCFTVPAHQHSHGITQ